MEVSRAGDKRMTDGLRRIGPAAPTSQFVSQKVFNVMASFCCWMTAPNMLSARVKTLKSFSKFR
jgi:hypothetical protein